MVKKLVKYDLKALFRILFPAQIVVVGVALLVRLEQIFETRTDAYRTLSYSSIGVFVLAMVGLLIATLAYCVQRYQKNLFSHEGYLTHALPVSAGQHIIAKLLSALIFTLFSLAVLLLSGFLATAGEVANEVVKAGWYLLSRWYDDVGFHAVIYLIEFVILALVSFARLYLLLFFCETVGQFAKKAKNLLAGGVFFGWYALLQILAVVLIVNGEWIFDLLRLEQFFAWVSDHPLPAVHLILWGLILLGAAFGAVWFFLTRTILKNKLNIE